MEREDIVARFDARAATYDEDPLHRALATAVVGFADLTDVTDVLDVATGTGLVLRDVPTGPRLAGVDVSPGMLAIARRHLPQAELVLADAAELPWPDASVDLVTCVTALHLLPDPDAAFTEWWRVLRPGGAIVTATFAHLAHGHGSGRPGSDHSRFTTPEAITLAAAPGTVTRHTVWPFEETTVLIAEVRLP